MRALSSAQLVGVWERGEGQDSVERALTLLSAACPEQTREELAALSIGRRDRYLLDLRRQIFGDPLTWVAACPQCATRLEYRLATEELRSRAPESRLEPPLLTTGEFSLRLRPPDSADLAAARGCATIEAARRSLAERCVLEARRDGAGLAATELPEALIAEISDFLAAADPLAEWLIDLNCPECGSTSQVLFDIASYLWTEIAALAKRLLREVHVLARAYGWREADILAMSAARRHFYLEMVG